MPPTLNTVVTRNTAVGICHRHSLLLRAVVSEKNENNLEKLYERASSTRPKLEKRAPNIGGFAANIACGFLEFWTCGTRSLIKFLEVSSFFSLTTARNNINGACYFFVLFLVNMTPKYHLLARSEDHQSRGGPSPHMGTSILGAY